MQFYAWIHISISDIRFDSQIGAFDCQLVIEELFFFVIRIKILEKTNSLYVSVYYQKKMIVCESAIDILDTARNLLIEKSISKDVYEQFDLIKRYTNDIIICMMSYFFKIKQNLKNVRWHVHSRMNTIFYLIILVCKECFFWVQLAKYVFCFVSFGVSNSWVEHSEMVVYLCD